MAAGVGEQVDVRVEVKTNRHQMLTVVASAACGVGKEAVAAEQRSAPVGKDKLTLMPQAKAGQIAVVTGEEPVPVRPVAALADDVLRAADQR